MWVFKATGLLQEWATFPLRLLVGFGFMAHGYAKLSRGPEHFAPILAALRVPQPHFMAWATCLLEFCGGIGVMAGAFVLPLSLPLIITMLTAMFSVHLQYGFSSVKLIAVTASGAQFGPVGYELNLLYIVALLTLAVSGPGKLSVDRCLAQRNREAVRSAPRPNPSATRSSD
jgi:putative oxidoreductase